MGVAVRLGNWRIFLEFWFFEQRSLSTWLLGAGYSKLTDVYPRVVRMWKIQNSTGR